MLANTCMFYYVQGLTSSRSRPIDKNLLAKARPRSAVLYRWLACPGLQAHLVKRPYSKESLKNIQVPPGTLPEPPGKMCNG